MSSRLSNLLARAAAAGIAATAFAAVASGAWLTLLAGGGRVREAGYFVLGSIPIAMGQNYYHDLPSTVSTYRAITGFEEYLRFASQLFMANLILNLVLVGGLILCLWQMGPIRRVLERGVFLHSAVLCLVALPVVYVAIRTVAIDQIRDPTTMSIVSTLVALAVVFGPLAILSGKVSQGWGAGAVRLISSVGLAVAAVLAISAAMPAAVASVPVAQPVGPNVLLISIDSLRADHLSGYGYERETSPRIDELMSEGVQFTTTIAAAPWTLPSHMSLFTGLDALGHGVWQDGRRLATGVPTLAQMLQQRGYQTAAVVAGQYLSASWGFGRGFSFYDDYSIGKLGGGSDHVQVTSPLVLDRAQQWIDGWADGSRDRPFFLFVHFWDVHYEYLPPSPYDRAFTTGDDGRVIARRQTGTSRSVRHDPSAQEYVVSQYDGEILYTDSHVGKLLDAIDAIGEREKTLVVLTADHGEEFYEHGRPDHRAGLYEEVMNVPFVMRWPGHIRPGTVIGAPVRSIDIAPTVLGYVGADPEDLSEPGGSIYASRDLSALIEDPSHQELPRIAFMDLHGGSRQAIRTTDRKFISEPKGVAELYDLENDEGELENLAYDNTEELAKFRELLRGWVDRRRSVVAGESTTTADQLEILRSLGYVQ